MKNLSIAMILMMSMTLFSCKEQGKQTQEQQEFAFQVDRFADIRIMRYQIPEFESLSLQQKELVYYLSQAALCGRDIIFDQNFKHNLTIRRTLETIYENYNGDRTTPEFKEFEVYLKRVWFANGIHHHYSGDKFDPGFSAAYFATLVNASAEGTFPLLEGESLEGLVNRLTPILFDPTVAPKRISQDAGNDLILASAGNYYEGVNQQEAEGFYNAMKDPTDPRPISYGLNSKLVKENGTVMEKIYKSGGMYGAAIDQIVFWLEKAAGVAENELQERVIRSLISYYQSGDLKTFDEYNILWLEDNQSMVDFVNGFIEVYGDPMGMKASWEAVVNFRNVAATQRTEVISANAQWFEDNSPVDARFKKKEVKGVSAKVITVAQLGGDCYPSTPIGINLPNADWIRKEHGSKSVTMDNITYAYDQAAMGNGFMEEFAATPEEIQRAEKYGYLASSLHTDMHECLGHGSGQILPGVSTEAMRNYHSPLEESRADLFALYYLMDPKMIELGLYDTDEVAKAAYDSFIRNGLMTQLTRIQPGKDIEQAHMRSRQLIAAWCYNKGSQDNVIERYVKEGKTFVKINDYQKLRDLFGQLLAEVQRIKSEGDYEAGKALVESFGVKVDPGLHQEILARYEKLNLAPYGGFMNPVLVPVEENGKMTDVRVEYPMDYAAQMMLYSKNYSFLPAYN